MHNQRGNIIFKNWDISYHLLRPCSNALLILATFQMTLMSTIYEVLQLYNKLNLTRSYICRANQKISRQAQLLKLTQNFKGMQSSKRLACLCCLSASHHLGTKSYQSRMIHAYMYKILNTELEGDFVISHVLCPKYVYTLFLKRRARSTISVSLICFTMPS